ncbi:MAG: creatininase family protein [Planctomycetaceae bacterium]|nr:creatininase family protein [Planctomycetaceae bacterium]
MTMKDDCRNPWNLAKTNYGVVRENHYETAVLPFGATEPHNLHLPYSTDTIEATVLGERICETAWNNGAKVILLPTIPYATQTNQAEFPFAMNLNPTTLFQVMTDLSVSLVKHGVRKIVLLNSHGGNEFKSFLRQIHDKSEAKFFLCNWFQIVNDVYHDIFQEPEDHAGEMETSLILAVYPELVARDAQGNLTADDGVGKPTRFEAVNRGWIGMVRPWHLFTTNTGHGYPHHASPEKGEKIIDVIVQRLSAFLVELSNSPIDDQFPY